VTETQREWRRPREDWVLEDPEGKPIERVREIRDQIKGRVAKLVDEIIPGQVESISE
jgi:protein-tyrosine-phosphatase